MSRSDLMIREVGSDEATVCAALITDPTQSLDDPAADRRSEISMVRLINNM